jgi:hypothetical protein
MLLYFFIEFRITFTSFYTEQRYAAMLCLFPLGKKYRTFIFVKFEELIGNLK